MNRCSSSTPLRWRVWGLGLALAALFLPVAPQAQTPGPQRIPPIAAKAQPGVLRITQPPEVLLNGQPARLAPGARLRDRNNLLVVSGALLDQDLPVRYTLDPLGLVHEAWVLTEAEVASLTPPAPTH